ncbi:MAG: hypothetical protein OEW48_12760 [Phycisphaerae bacterium]|nr:hypothetical protein [Phycisphaerae bacterium]
MDAPGQSDFSPSEGIFKWWTIITLVTDVAILLFACLPVRTLLWNLRGAILIDMLVFASIIARAGGIGLVIFASNAYLLGRILYHKCKSRQLDEKLAVRTIMSEIGIKVWTVLILLINISAIVFPFLIMYIRRPDVSYAEMHGEVYPPAHQPSGLTADKLLYLCVFLWTIIFASNTVLLFRSLFHKCDRGEHFIS